MAFAGGLLTALSALGEAPDAIAKARKARADLEKEQLETEELRQDAISMKALGALDPSDYGSFLQQFSPLASGGAPAGQSPQGGIGSAAPLPQGSMAGRGAGGMMPLGYPSIPGAPPLTGGLPAQAPGVTSQSQQPQAGPQAPFVNPTGNLTGPPTGGPPAGGAPPPQPQKNAQYYQSSYPGYGPGPGLTPQAMMQSPRAQAAIAGQIQPPSSPPPFYPTGQAQRPQLQPMQPRPVQTQSFGQGQGPAQQGTQPQQMGGGGLNLQQLAKVIKDRNPNISGEAMFKAMQHGVNLLTPVAKMEMQNAMMEYRMQDMQRKIDQFQQSDATRRDIAEGRRETTERGQDIGLEKTREGIASRERLRGMGNSFAQVGPDGKYELNTSDMSRVNAILNGWEDPRNTLFNERRHDPQASAIMQAVRNIADKDREPWDQSAYARRAKGEGAFTSGTQATRITALGTAQRHLKTLVDLTDALDNSDFTLANRIANAAGFATGQTGIAGARAAQEIVAAELVKAIVASGGGVKDRADMAANLDVSRMSPDQIRASAETFENLLSGQLEGWRNQWESFEGRTGRTGKKSFDDTFNIKQQHFGPRETAPAGKAPSTSRAAPKSKEEYDALPSGTEFTDPEGNVRRKP